MVYSEWRRVTRGSVATACVIGYCAIAFNAGAFLDHWNTGTGGKPSRNSLVWERGPTNATVLWEGGVNSVGGDPPVMEGDVVVMSRLNISSFDRPEVQRGVVIVAQHVATGQVLWTNSLPIDFPETDWYSAVKGIRDGRVYATRAGGGDSAYLYALDAKTGDILWRSQERFDMYGEETPAFLPKGDLLVGTLFRITRVCATNGASLWSSSRTVAASGGSESAVFGARGYTWDGSVLGLRVSAFDLETGQILYTSAVLGAAAQQEGVFAGPGGMVYAPISNPSGELVALKDTGKSLVELWRVPIGYVVFGSFGIGPDGSVYAYSRDHRVIRINPGTGAVIGSSQVLSTDSNQHRMVIDSSGTLFVNNGSYNGGMLFSFNRDLSLRWADPIGGVNLGGPAIGKNGTLVICGKGADVRAYRGNSEGWLGPPVQIEREGNNLVITYSGTLESSQLVNGPWEKVPGVASPWTVPMLSPQRFYRSCQE